jgi:hypothetical protein
VERVSEGRRDGGRVIEGREEIRGEEERKEVVGQVREKDGRTGRYRETGSS